MKKWNSRRRFILEKGGVLEVKLKEAFLVEERRFNKTLTPEKFSFLFEDQTLKALLFEEVELKEVFLLEELEDVFSF